MPEMDATEDSAKAQKGKKKGKKDKSDTVLRGPSPDHEGGDGLDQKRNGDKKSKKKLSTRKDGILSNKDEDDLSPRVNSLDLAGSVLKRNKDSSSKTQSEVRDLSKSLCTSTSDSQSSKRMNKSISMQNIAKQLGSPERAQVSPTFPGNKPSAETKREIAMAKRAYRRSMTMSQKQLQPAAGVDSESAYRLRVQQLEVKNRVLADEFHRLSKKMAELQESAHEKKAATITHYVMRPASLPKEMSRLASSSALPEGTTLHSFLQSDDTLYRGGGVSRLPSDDGSEFAENSLALRKKKAEEEDLLREETPHSNAEGSLLEIDTRDVLLVEELNRGGSARIFVGKWRCQDVCVKVIRNQVQSEKFLQDLEIEFGLLSQVKSKYNLIVHGFCKSPCFCMITEFCERGSLLHVMSSSMYNPVFHGWNMALKMASELLRGVMYLHNWVPPIVHRDIKSGNLLVDSSWNLKIGDFGLSRFVTDESMRGTLKDVRSTLTHCAPEVWKGRHWTPASDMYSVAIVMWEMGTRVLTGKYVAPFADRKELRMDYQVMMGAADGLRPKKFAVPSTAKGINSFYSLISDCWEGDPAARPSFAEALQRLDKILEDYKENYVIWDDTLPKCLV